MNKNINLSERQTLEVITVDNNFPIDNLKTKNLENKQLQQQNKRRYVDYSISQDNSNQANQINNFSQIQNQSANKQYKQLLSPQKKDLQKQDIKNQQVIKKIVYSQDQNKYNDRAYRLLNNKYIRKELSEIQQQLIKSQSGATEEDYVISKGLELFFENNKSEQNQLFLGSDYYDNLQFLDQNSLGLLQKKQQQQFENIQQENDKQQGIQKSLTKLLAKNDLEILNDNEFDIDSLFRLQEQQNILNGVQNEQQDQQDQKVLSGRKQNLFQQNQKLNEKNKYFSSSYFRFAIRKSNEKKQLIQQHNSKIKTNLMREWENRNAEVKQHLHAIQNEQNKSSNSKFPSNRQLRPKSCIGRQKQQILQQQQIQGLSQKKILNSDMAKIFLGYKDDFSRTYTSQDNQQPNKINQYFVQQGNQNQFLQTQQNSSVSNRFFTPLRKKRNFYDEIEFETSNYSNNQNQNLANNLENSIIRQNYQNSAEMTKSFTSFNKLESIPTENNVQNISFNNNKSKIINKNNCSKKNNINNIQNLNLYRARAHSNQKQIRNLLVQGKVIKSVDLNNLILQQKQENFDNKSLSQYSKSPINNRVNQISKNQNIINSLEIVASPFNNQKNNNNLFSNFQFSPIKNNQNHSNLLKQNPDNIKQNKDNYNKKYNSKTPNPRIKNQQIHKNQFNQENPFENVILIQEQIQTEKCFSPQQNYLQHLENNRKKQILLTDFSLDQVNSLDNKF